MLLALVLAQALSPIGNPAGPIFNQPSLMGRGAAFEALPLSGSGIAGACTTTSPTGTKGEALGGFTRTGNATCSRNGPATTGIVPGDLTILSDGVPRFSYVGSLLMFLRESSSLEVTLRTEEISAAPWANDLIGASVVVVTADAALSPTNTMTADRLQVPASAAGQYTIRYQPATCSSGSPCTFSCFVMGVSTSGTTDICTGASAGECGDCAFVAGSYTRCSKSVASASGVNSFIGNATSFNGGTARSAVDIYVWGCNSYLSTKLYSYTPAVGSTVTRNADSALTATSTVAIGPSFSLGVSTAYISSSVTTATALQLGSAATDLARVGRNSDTAAALLINATSTTPTVTAQGTTLHRGSLNDNAATRSAWWDGASITAPASSMVGATTAITFGALDSYTGRVCADGVSGRCD